MGIGHIDFAKRIHHDLIRRAPLTAEGWTKLSRDLRMIARDLDDVKSNNFSGIASACARVVDEISKSPDPANVNTAWFYGVRWYR